MQYCDHCYYTGPEEANFVWSGHHSHHIIENAHPDTKLDSISDRQVSNIVYEPIATGFFIVNFNTIDVIPNSQLNGNKL